MSNWKLIWIILLNFSCSGRIQSSLGDQLQNNNLIESHFNTRYPANELSDTSFLDKSYYLPMQSFLSSESFFAGQLPVGSMGHRVTFLRNGDLEIKDRSEFIPCGNGYLRIRDGMWEVADSNQLKIGLSGENMLISRFEWVGIYDYEKRDSGLVFSLVEERLHARKPYRR